MASISCFPQVIHLAAHLDNPRGAADLNKLNLNKSIVDL